MSLSDFRPVAFPSSDRNKCMAKFFFYVTKCGVRRSESGLQSARGCSAQVFRQKFSFSETNKTRSSGQLTEIYISRNELYDIERAIAVTLDMLCRISIIIIILPTSTKPRA